MPTYCVVVGWARADDDPTDYWRLQIGAVEADPDALQPDTLIKVPEQISYLPFAVLSERSGDFFSGLHVMVSSVDGDQYLLGAMEEVLNAAYQAGRRNVIPPNN